MAAYEQITRASLSAELAARLGDPDGLFWVSAERVMLIEEALRTWQALTGYWRARAEFEVNATDGAFYDLPTRIESLLAYSMTDRDLIGMIQYHLLETYGPTAWAGTEMWTLDDVSGTVQRRRNQLIADTGCTVVRSTTLQVQAGVSRIALPDGTIDVRRAAFVDVSGTMNVLAKSDTFVRGTLGASALFGRPRAYQMIGETTLQLELIPAPSDNGTLDLLITETGSDLDPATSATILRIPDNYAWAIKWGALADLLSMVGPGQDEQRAAYCRNRYEQAVEIIRSMPVVIGAEVNGVSLNPPPLHSLDQSPAWQNSTGTVRVVALAAPNMIAAYPVPNGAASIVLDVVRNAPIPEDDDSFIQLGKEQLTAILNYAEHLARFKLGGAEFYFSSRLMNEFIAAAVQQNEKLAATALYKSTIERQSTAESDANPSRWRRQRDAALQ